MTRFRLLAAEALRSIGANKSTTLAAAVTVLVGMFLLGVFIGLGTWLVSWSDAKKKELVVHVFLKEDATNKQINAVLADPEIKARVAGLDGTVLVGSPADFGKLIAEETEKWGKVIHAANIKAE